MAKIQRNALCPCGSGKKYKKCCMAKETAAAAKPDYGKAMADLRALDKLSNRVVDLVDSGKLDMAERLCQQLLEEYPDQVDGIERLAMVYEARGKKKEAAEQYRKAADFMRSHPGFDEEGIEWMLEKAAELEPDT